MSLRHFPLLSRFRHGGTARMAANLKVAFALGIFRKRLRELIRLREQNIGIGDATILEGEVAQHQIRLRIAREFDRRVLQFSPRRHQLVYSQPKHGHHHARRGQLRIV